MAQTKKHYYILLNGKHVGDSWAVSSQKAITNWWWRNVKQGSEYTPRSYSPADLDAVAALRR